MARDPLVGVVVAGDPMYGLVRSLRGIEQAAGQAGLGLVVSAGVGGLRPRSADPLGEWSALDLRAVVVLGGRVPECLEAATVPVVLVGGGDGAGVPSVAVDQVAGARRVTGHLLAQGCCTVWHVGGPEGWPESVDREQGWREALEDAGSRQPPVVRGDWSPRSGYAVGELLLSEHGIDAVFVANDRMALGLCRAFADGGRPVPADVRVAGFDNAPEARYLTPSLTTVHHDFREVGRRVVSLIAELGETAAVREERQVLVPDLVVRGSTDANWDARLLRA